MELAASREPDEPKRNDGPRQLRPAAGHTSEVPAGGGQGPVDAAKIVDVLKASADQELTIADQLSTKARQAFALGAGVFVVAQTVAFGNFDAKKISTREQHWIIALAIFAVLILGLAAIATLRADSTVVSGDLPLSKLEGDLNAAYAGDGDVVGRLGEYFLGVVRSRRAANSTRRSWYGKARLAVAASLLATTAELVFALIARIT
jgi:hypothetical protein